MTRILVLTLIVLIIVAHVFLWRSDMSTDMKVVFTTINATAWTIILAPIFLVGRWLDATERRNRERQSEDIPDRLPNSSLDDG